MSESWRKLKSRATGFLILAVPTTVMVTFIVWAVFESSLNNATDVLELDDNRCLVKTTWVALKTWLEDNNGEDLLSVGGGTRVIAMISRTNGDDCGDIFPG